jgi:MYXO-CTERM domain-containing protein
MKLTSLAIGALLASAAYGATLYNTMGPDNQFVLSGSTIGGPSDNVVANLIHPNADGKAGSITLAMGHTSGENLYRMDFAAWSESGPSSTPFYSREFSLTGDLTTIQLPDGPELFEDVEFWLVISGAGESTQGAWWGNGLGALGTVAWHNNTPPTLAAPATDWNILGDQVLGGARIETDVAATETPEPSNALLAGAGLLLAGWVRRKRA